MIYTVGIKANYDLYLARAAQNNTVIRKSVGGSVWETREEAQKVADQNPGFAVYGVLAQWETMTTPTLQDTKGVKWHDLTIESQIIALDP